MRVLVCGSREWKKPQIIWNTLKGFVTEYGTDLVIIEGGNPKGADAIAADFADKIGIEHEQEKAIWDEHHPDWCPGDWCGLKKTYCVGAGARRNQTMLVKHFPDLVLAFKDNLDRSLKKGGTEDMMQRALDAKIPVYHIERFCA